MDFLVKPWLSTLVSLVGIGFFSANGLSKDVVPVQSEVKRYIHVALGDSVTKAFNSKELGNNPVMSWSTGSADSVVSHFRRLNLSGDSEVKSTNLAISGSTVKGFADQVSQAVKLKPDYVTVLIGANDVCKWPADYKKSLANYQMTVDNSIKSLAEANSQTRVLMVPIPDLENVYKKASSRGMCRLVWNFFGICPKLLHSESTDEDRKLFVEQWEAANKALATVAAKHPNHVLWLGDLQGYEFQRHHVSELDCFHPSIEGQDLLARVTWRPEWVEADSLAGLSTN